MSGEFFPQVRFTAACVQFYPPLPHLRGFQGRLNQRPFFCLELPGDSGFLPL